MQRRHERDPRSAGYGDIRLARSDTQMTIGRDLGEAIDYVRALGPAGAD